MPDSNALLRATSLAYVLRECASRHLPMQGSNIPLDICLAVAQYFETNRPLTMKQLVHELPYSEAGIQYNLRWLRQGEWVDMERNEADRRVRCLVPTTRLLEALRAFQEEAFELVDLLRTQPERIARAAQEQIDAQQLKPAQESLMERLRGS